MAFYKVSISAHKEWFDHSKLKMVQEDIDEVYYVEEDSPFEALIIADKLLITAYYGVDICDAGVTEIAKDEIPLHVRYYTKADAL